MIGGVKFALAAGTLPVALVFGLSTAAKAACETTDSIEVAKMSWPSASFLADIDQKILTAGYGCQVTLVPGDTVPATAAMISKGRPQIIPELWFAYVKDVFEKGEQDGKVAVAGKTFGNGGEEHWYIPKYVADANPGLKNVEDLPKYKKLFADPDAPSKGRLYSAPTGWGVQIETANQFKAFGLDSTYNLYDPGSSAALDASIARAYERKQPIVTYYWSPSTIIGKYTMVPLEMPPYNEEGHLCNIKKDCTNPYPGAYPVSTVVSAITTGLKKQAPSIAGFMSNQSLDTPTLNKLLAWADTNSAESGAAAEHFLKTETAIWTKWVPADVADRVNKSLQ
jgi:glycine betaine/proline transport system substrate-binding protein